MGADNIFDEKQAENIGSGLYGEVKRAIYIPDNKRAAIKIINSGPLRANYTNKIQDRIIQIQKLSHRNITKYYEKMNIRDDYLLYFGMELCDYNLKQFIDKNNNMEIGIIYDILFQLNKAFQIMEDNNIVHGNIKLENILIKSEENKNEFKLSGFEMIPEFIRYTKNNRPNKICKYLPPEILREKNKEFRIDSKADLWSLGLIIYYLYFKVFPYQGETCQEVLEEIENIELKKTNFVELDDIISGLLEPDKNRRLTWNRYLNHPFFNNNGFWKKYNIEKEIGKGQFSVVYKASHKDNKALVAIKIINFSQIDKLKVNNDIKNEIIEELKNRIKIMKHLNKNKEKENHIIEIYELFESGNSIAISMELFDYNLKEYIDKFLLNPDIRTSDLFYFLLELNKSLKFLVEKKTIIGNLKLENILIRKKIAKDYSYKLTDIGLCPNLIKVIKKYPGKEQLIYLSQNSYNYGIYEYIDDLYSLGIIIHYFKFKNFPLKESNFIELKDQEEKKEPNDNSDLFSLIDGLLEKDPKKRLTWEKYFKHQYFINRDYTKYYEIEGGPLLEGAYYSINKVIEKKTLQKRMMKLIDKKNIRDKYFRINLVNVDEADIKKLEDFLIKQTEIMKILEAEGKNENTIKFFEYFQTQKELAIILEQCDSNLSKFFIDRNENFSLNEIFDLLTQLNNTFQIMYKKNIIHGDLKLENIIILFNRNQNDNKKYIYKLTDYGQTKEFLSLTEKFFARNGAPRYTAPEILKGGDYTMEGDLWSLGVIIYILFFRKPPYEGNTNKDVLKSIRENGQNKLEFSNKPEFDNLVRRLLSIDPKERLTWKQYFEHPFLVGGDCWKFYSDKFFINDGVYYKVYRVIVKETNEKRIIKVMDLKLLRQSFARTYLRNCTDDDLKEYIDDFIKECKNMDLLRGPKKDNINALIFYEYFQTKNEFCIVHEACDGNLSQMIFKRKLLKIKDVNLIYQVLNQLNNTFHIIINNNLSHKDLQLDNIIVKIDKKNGGYIFKLAGLEFNRKVISLLGENEIMLNERYKAPELLDIKFDIEDIPSEKLVNFYQKADLWSLGVIVFILYFGKFPYEGNKPEDIYNNIMRNENSKLNEINDSNLKDLVKKLLTEDPEKRISWNEYFAHPFFSEEK